MTIVRSRNAEIIVELVERTVATLSDPDPVAELMKSLLRVVISELAYER